MHVILMAYSYKIAILCRREQAKQLLTGQQRPRPEAKAIGVRPPSENNITPSDMPPTLLGGVQRDSAAPRPIGQYTPSGSRNSTGSCTLKPIAQD